MAPQSEATQDSRTRLSRRSTVRVPPAIDLSHPTTAKQMQALWLIERLQNEEAPPLPTPRGGRGGGGSFKEKSQRAPGQSGPSPSANHKATSHAQSPPLRSPSHQSPSGEGASRLTSSSFGADVIIRASSRSSSQESSSIGSALSSPRDVEALSGIARNSTVGAARSPAASFPQRVLRKGHFSSSTQLEELGRQQLPSTSPVKDFHGQWSPRMARRGSWQGQPKSPLSPLAGEAVTLNKEVPDWQHGADVTRGRSRMARHASWQDMTSSGGPQPAFVQPGAAPQHESFNMQHATYSDSLCTAEFLSVAQGQGLMGTRLQSPCPWTTGLESAILEEENYFQAVPGRDPTCPPRSSQGALAPGGLPTVCTDSVPGIMKALRTTESLGECAEGQEEDSEGHRLIQEGSQLRQQQHQQSLRCTDSLSHSNSDESQEASDTEAGEQSWAKEGEQEKGHMVLPKAGLGTESSFGWADGNPPLATQGKQESRHGVPRSGMPSSTQEWPQVPSRLHVRHVSQGHMSLDLSRQELLQAEEWEEEEESTDQQRWRAPATPRRVAVRYNLPESSHECDPKQWLWSPRLKGRRHRADGHRVDGHRVRAPGPAPVPAEMRGLGHDRPSALVQETSAPPCERLQPSKGMPQAAKQHLAHQTSALDCGFEAGGQRPRQLGRRHSLQEDPRTPSLRNSMTPSPRESMVGPSGPDGSGPIPLRTKSKGRRLSVLESGLEMGVGSRDSGEPTPLDATGQRTVAKALRTERVYAEAQAQTPRAVPWDAAGGSLKVPAGWALEKLQQGMKRLGPFTASTANVLGLGHSNVTEHYSFGRRLGKGQFGVTRLVEHRATGEHFACKTISKASLKVHQDVEDVRREHAILRALRRQPQVAQLLEAHEDAEEIHFIMELCQGGELFDRLKEKKRFSEDQAACVIRTVVEVLRSCHECLIMHRDIKPENILLCSRDSDTDVKIIDFGVAAVLTAETQMLHETMGSFLYMAPEVIKGRYSLQADIWSAGVVLYIMLTGRPPFWSKTPEGLKKAICDGKLRFSPKDQLSSGAVDLIHRMLNKDPNQRATADEILGHWWIVENCPQ